MKKLFGAMLSIALMTGGAFVAPTVAQADADDMVVCTPERTIEVKHEALTHKEQRWTQDIEAIKKVSHQEAKYKRQNPGQKETFHDEFLLMRMNPGQKETSTTRYQFSRQNPGHGETFETFFKYYKVVKGTDGVRECKWKTSVDDFKTKIQYQKQVKGIIQKKVGKSWQDVGTFDWEWYISPSYKWSFEDKSVLESGGHNSVQAEWSEGGYQYRKITQAYQYVKNGTTEQVKTGSHWEYQWATEKPGDNWTKTDECRWKDGIEPQPDQTIWYKDGAWTNHQLGDPWIKGDEQEFGNGDAVEPFVEYKTKDGVTTDKSKADYFREVLDGWTPIDGHEVGNGDAVAAFWEYLTKTGVTLVEAEADYFEGTVEDWIPFDAKEVVTQKPVEGYTIYYMENGQHSRDLTDANWTRKNPGGKWTLVDRRVVEDRKAYTTEKVIPAVPCDDFEDASDGARNEAPVWPLVIFGLAFVAGAAGLGVYVVQRRRNRAEV